MVTSIVVYGFVQQLIWVNNTEIVLGRCENPNNIPYHKYYDLSISNPSYKMPRK
jgi:hypothetical protein